MAVRVRTESGCYGAWTWVLAELRGLPVTGTLGMDSWTWQSLCVEKVDGDLGILNAEDSKLTLGHPHQPLGNVSTH